MARHAIFGIEVLGPVRALRDGAEIPVGGPVDRAVLGTLAVRAGERVPVEVLLAAAYGGLPRAAAKRALHTAVWRLRRALGEDRHRLITDHGGYRLDLDARACDAGALKLDVARAGQACREGHAEHAIALLSQATARWRGRSPELPPPVTEALEALMGEALEKLAEVLLAAGRPGDALEQARRLVALDPDHHGAAALVEEAARRHRDEANLGPDPQSAASSVTSRTDGDQSSIAARRAQLAGQLVAILGRCTLAELAATVASWHECSHRPHPPPSGAALLDALTVAEAEGLLAVTAEPALEATITSPAAARRALEGTSRSERLGMHAAAAAGLVAVHGDGPGTHLVAISMHLGCAVPAVRAEVAIENLSTAARSLPGADAETAALLLQAGLDLQAAWLPTDRARHLALLHDLGAAREALGDAAGADTAWGEAAELATALEQPADLARAALRLAGTPWRPRRHPPAAELLEQSVGALPPAHVLRPLVLQRRIQLEKYAPEHGSSPIQVVTDRLLLAGVAPEDLAADATFALMRWARSVEEGTGSLHDDPATEALVAEDPSPLIQHLARRWAITRLIAAGRLRAAEKRLSDLAGLLPALTDGTIGDVDGGLGHEARRASALQLATIRLYQRRSADAVSLLDAGLAGGGMSAPVSRPHNDERALIALHLARSGSPSEARSLLSAVLTDLWERPHDHVRYATAVNAAFVAADLAEGDAVRKLTAELEPSQGRHCVMGHAGYAGVTEHALGRLHAAAGELEQADELLATAAAAHARVGADLWTNLTRFWRAGVLQRLGGTARRSEAAALLDEVRRAAALYTADPWAA